MTLQSIFTLSALAVLLAVMAYRRKWTGGAVAAGLFCSIGGDLLLSNRGGLEWRFLAGIVAFSFAHLCFLSYAWHRGRRWNRYVLTIGGGIYGGYFFFLSALSAITWLQLGFAATYTVLSLLTLAAAAGMRRSVAGMLFVGGIASLLFSDTIISLREFWHWHAADLLILPTYVLSQILITASVLGELQTRRRCAGSYDDIARDRPR